MGKAKTLNNVVINMTLKPTQTRAKLSTSSEDLAVQMGKINKWYDSLVPTGGASGNILEWDSDGVAKWVSPSFLDEKVKSTLLAQSTAEGSYRPTFVTGAGTGGVNIIDSFKVNHSPGTTSAVGNTRLILGNATASGTANNEEGQLKLYSSGTSFHTLKGTTVSSEVIHVLPSTAGTILNTGTTSYTQTVASSVTGAYEIGKIKINGTTTTIYGKDTNTTYTASDGIKIESNVIKHTNSITTASSVFKKISYDAQGHITGTANVTKSDIPALDYIAKPGQVGSASRPIYINSSSVPTQCDTPSSGAYWAGVPYVGSNGVMEIGKYIDFHGTNASTNDYDYRISAETQTLYFAPKSSGDATYNLIRMQSPDYNQIQFQTTKSGKAYTSTGIVAYPLTTSGQTMLIQSDGNTVVGGGESPRTLYSNSYDNMDTAENETLYLASDSSEIHFITNCQAYSTRKVLKVADGQLVKSGGQWIAARDNAPVYANKPNAQDGGYYPAWFAKTKSGGWSMGVLSAQDNLYITYTTDTDYSGGNNNNTYTIQFQNKSGTVALLSDIPSLSGYLPLSGGTMTGTITHPANTVAINLRDDGTSTWQNTIMTQSSGDEAVVFANANARTSWMFVNGEDSIAHPENDRWQSLTPALQIKGGCVAIGKLIPHGTAPTTKLDVAGDARISGTLYIDSDAYINRVYGNTADFECFQPRHSNEFSMKEMASYTYVWFNYRLITDDKQGYTTEPTKPINQYWFGCGKARNALAKVVTSGMIIYPGAANTTSYSTTLQGATLTANRTATLPNATGTIPLVTEKYNSPTSTATSYNLTNAKTFKYLIITTKPSKTFGSTTTIVEAPTSATITKTAVSYSDNSSESSPPTRMLSGIIQVNYTDESNCVISTSHATHYIQAGSAVASNSASSVSIYITRIVGVSY